MRYEFKLPDLAEGMVEGEIVSWLVDSGDDVKDEQPVVEVMTDKATVVISSPRSGKLLEQSYEPGDIAPVGTVLFVLEVEGDGEQAEAQAPADDQQGAEAAAVPGVAAPRARLPKEDAAGVSTKPFAPPAPRDLATGLDSAPPVVPRGAGKALATPATRRLARELSVDIGQVPGTGPGGRVEKADVHAFLAGGPAPASREIGAPATAPTTPMLVVRDAAGEESEERVKIRGLRRAIYETMARSKATAAHFTYVEEIDCTNLVEVRRRLKPAAEAMGVPMTYLPLIAKAVLLALNGFPKMNASVDDEAGEIVLKAHRHLGIAVATPQGLTVPVVRFADGLTLLELAGRIVDVADKAREGRLAPHEAGGSTITITSLGKTGGLLATPIINHPEVAILGVHKMQMRPVVRDGEIVARQMMNISLSFDHRVIDGHEGAEFGQRIKAYLEDPELMLLEMS